MEWYYICWPWLTAKRVEPVVSISWASCFTSMVCVTFVVSALQRSGLRWRRATQSSRSAGPSGSGSASACRRSTGVRTTGLLASSRTRSGCRPAIWPAAVPSCADGGPTWSSDGLQRTCRRPRAGTTEPRHGWWSTGKEWRCGGTTRGLAEWRGSRGLSAVERKVFFAAARQVSLDAARATAERLAGARSIGRCRR